MRRALMWLNLYGFESIIPIWPNNKVTIADFTVYARSTVVAG